MHSDREKSIGTSWTTPLSHIITLMLSDSCELRREREREREKGGGGLISIKECQQRPVWQFATSSQSLYLVVVAKFVALDQTQWVFLTLLFCGSMSEWHPIVPLVRGTVIMGGTPLINLPLSPMHFMYLIVWSFSLSGSAVLCNGVH